MTSKQISKKIILIGSFAVGKTSLTNRFVHSRFSNEYIATLGVKIDKKMVDVDGTGLNMIIWDIADITTNSVVPESYFQGTHGIIYVFDLTRSATYLAMQKDLAYLEEKLPGVPIRIVGNKSDLVDPSEMEDILGQCTRQPDMTTSAKSGDNVEELFVGLGKMMI